jgi:hypothetical protein
MDQLHRHTCFTKPITKPYSRNNDFRVHAYKRTLYIVMFVLKEQCSLSYLLSNKFLKLLLPVVLLNTCWSVRFVRVGGHAIESHVTQK